MAPIALKCLATEAFGDFVLSKRRLQAKLKENIDEDSQGYGG